MDQRLPSHAASCTGSSAESLIAEQAVPGPSIALAGAICSLLESSIPACACYSLTAHDLLCLAADDRIAIEHGLRRILLVDPDPRVGASLADLFGERMTIAHTNAPRDAEALLMPDQFGLIVLDCALGGAVHFLELAACRCPDTPILFYTHTPPESASAAHANAILLKDTSSAEMLRDMIALLLELASTGEFK